MYFVFLVISWFIFKSGVRWFGGTAMRFYGSRFTVHKVVELLTYRSVRCCDIMHRWGFRPLFGLRVTRCSKSLLLRHLLFIFPLFGRLLLFSIDEDLVAAVQKYRRLSQGTFDHIHYFLFCISGVHRAI